MKLLAAATAANVKGTLGASLAALAPAVNALLGYIPLGASRGFSAARVDRPRDPGVLQLASEPYGVDTDGLDLLQHVRVQYPDVVRFLVTGSTDIHVAMRAVNEGACHRYFLKPWSEDMLRDALEIVMHARRVVV